MTNSTYTTKQMMDQGWYWEEDPQSKGRIALLRGTCLKCNHPVMITATRIFGGLRGKAFELSFRSNHMPRWKPRDLPLSDQKCICAHDDHPHGCGAVYQRVDLVRFRQ